MPLAANFAANRVDVFDSTFTPVPAAEMFSDPTLPAGYAPFNVAEIGGQIFVTYASESVIDGIAHALQLDDPERAHLLDLIRAAGATRPPRRQPDPQRVRPPRAAHRRVDDRHARVRAQRAARHPDRQPPRARAVLTDLRRPGTAGQHLPIHLPRPARQRVLLRDWEKIANDTAALLRAEAGRNPTTGHCRI
jgi:hypothetical protein